MSTRFTHGVVAGVVSTVAAAVGTVLVPGVSAAATDTKPPSAPANLRVQSVSSTSATLTWAPSTDDSGWVMYEGQAATPSPSLQRFASIGPATTVTGLQPGLTYTAEVVAMDGARNMSAPISIQFTTPVDAAPPTTPGNLQAVSVGGKVDSLRWDAAADSSGVHYVLRSSGNRIYGTDNTSATAFELVIQDCVVLPGSTHTVTVEAYDDHNNVSGRSNAITVTFPQ